MPLSDPTHAPLSERSIAIYVNTHLLDTSALIEVSGSVDAIKELEKLYREQRARINAITKHLAAGGVKASKWLAQEIALARDLLVKLQIMKRELPREEIESEAVPSLGRVLDPREATLLAQVIAEAYATGVLREFQPQKIGDTE